MGAFQSSCTASLLGSANREKTKSEPIQDSMATAHAAVVISAAPARTLLPHAAAWARR